MAGSSPDRARPHAIRPTLPRWDPLNPSNIVAAVLLGWAFTVYHRPYLPLIIPSYVAFDEILPWTAWGWWAGVAGAWLLASPPATGYRAGGHVLAALFFVGVGVAFTGGVGVTSAATTYGVLAVASTLMAIRAAVQWQSRRAWWEALATRPPRWLRWLARVGEYERSGRGR